MNFLKTQGYLMKKPYFLNRNLSIAFESSIQIFSMFENTLGLSECYERMCIYAYEVSNFVLDYIFCHICK